MTESVNYADYIERSALKEYTFSATYGDWVYANDSTKFYPVDKNNKTYSNAQIGVYNRVIGTTSGIDINTFMKIFNSTSIISIKFKQSNYITESFINYKCEGDNRYNIIFSSYVHANMINSSQSYVQLTVDKPINENNILLTFGVINIDSPYYASIPGSTITFTIKYIQL